MEFADPQERATAYLILRHLYDGDIIEWPIADDHALHNVFAALEAQGYVARWDRTWPRHDRYRLTDKGIAEIERVYRPTGAEALFNDLRGRNMDPQQRRTYLMQQGYDPVLWPLLHDPTTHWSMFHQDRGRYYDWFWEDQLPYRYRRNQQRFVPDSDDDDVDDVISDLDDGSAQPAAAAYVVDLDREAGASASGVGAASTADYDVS